MSTRCLVCSSTLFRLVDGANTCIECGSHQINFVELVEEEEAWDPERTRFFITRNNKADKKDFKKVQKDNKLDWSFIEAYNIILKRWTDILVENGASEKFKDAVFKLWVCYLRKRGIAFCNKDPDSSSRAEVVGVFDARDMVVLKNAKIQEKEKKEKKEKPVKELLEKVQAKVERKILQAQLVPGKKRKFSSFLTKQLSDTLNAVNEGEEEEMEEEDNESENGDEVKMIDVDNNSDDGMVEDLFNDNPPSDEKDPLDATKEETNEENEDGVKLSRNTRKKHIVNNSDIYTENFLLLSPTHLTLEKLLALVYLGLLLAQEDILLLDLLRWSREDFLPFQSAGYILSKNKNLSHADRQIFNRTLPLAVEIRYHAGTMAFFLSLQTLPLPSLDKVMNKLVDSLKLPDDVREISLHILRCFIFTGYTQISVPPLEITAAAAILLAFKVTYGLNDVHEEILSDGADAINKILKYEKKKYRLFSWRKWHKHMNRILHWTDTMMVSNQSSVGSGDQIKPKFDFQRFDQYFWSKGIWRTPMEVQTKKADNTDSWDSVLLTYSLGLNLKRIDQVASTEQVFTIYKTPLIGLLDQYLCGAKCYDSAEDSNQQYDAAEKLSSVSFSTHRFNWILHRQEIIAEFKDFCRDLDIIKIPIEKTQEAKSIITQLKEKKKKLDIIYVPDPLKCYRPVDPSSPLEDLSRNFQWLLKLFCQICETSKEDIMKQFTRMERKYLTAVKVENTKFKQISIAEGENMRDFRL